MISTKRFFLTAFVSVLSVYSLSAAAEEIKANNLRYVNARWEEGKEKTVSFRKDGKNWEEHNQWNGKRFTWEETNKDEWSVYLKMGVDKAQIDLHTKKVIFERNGKKEEASIFDIKG